MPKIYLDNAASTPIDAKVVREMAKATGLYGNPSSYNDCGRETREYIEKARLKVARFLGAHSDEIIFTASGTEANNLAIQGIARNFKFLILNFKTKPKSKNSKPHVIITQIEHPSVLEPVRRLEKEGFNVSYLSVNHEGFISLEELKKALRPETILVSVMYANNEIGTIQPIVKISKIINDFRNRLLAYQLTSLPAFHVDACQATEYLDMNINHLGVDMLTFNGSKVYGPRGVGVLYKRRGVALSPLLLGGEQESGLRAGTENVPAIGGLAVALDNINKTETERLTRLRDYFIKEIKSCMQDILVSGALGNQRLPNNVHISVPGLSSEVMLLELDKYGICAGSGSACTSHSVEPSHVLKAIGVEKKYLDGALRFSMGRQTTKGDLDYVSKVLPKVIGDLKRRYKKI
ncbi:MAG: cysteine desulfurase family protein [Patescibacteria group bacterium]